MTGHEETQNDNDADRSYRIYELCKEAFNNEVSRHNALSLKANIYLSLIGAILAALSIKIDNFVVLIVTLPYCWFITEMLLYSTCFTCFLLSVWNIITAITIKDYITYKQDIFDEYKYESTEVIFASLAKYMSNASKTNFIKNNKKAEHLYKALVFVRIGLVCLLVAFLIIVNTKIFGG